MSIQKKSIIIKKKINSRLIYEIRTHSKILKQFWKNCRFYQRQVKSIRKCFLMFIFQGSTMEKVHLIRASLPMFNITLGSESCGKRNCQVRQSIVNIDTFRPITTDDTFPFSCNSKNVMQKKCKNPYVGKAQTKFLMCLKIIKVLQDPSKQISEEHRNYFTDIIYRMIVMVRMIHNLPPFQMTLMSLKDLVCNIVAKKKDLLFSYYNFQFSCSDLLLS